MSQLLPLLAAPGVDPALRELASSPDAGYHRIQLEDTLYAHGASAPDALLDRLINANLLQWIGDRLALSRNGRKTQLLVQALEGGDLADIYRRLQRIDGRPSYELVREGMTEAFFAGLTRTAGRLGRLYLCSPWINASEPAIKHLQYAFLQRPTLPTPAPELLVVTRPPSNDPNPSLAAFRGLGARIFYQPRLHSKLYIREPDQSGGTLLAVVGSQNLTRSRYLELGIRIAGDDQLVHQLIRYFMDLTSMSSES